MMLDKRCFTRCCRRCCRAPRGAYDSFASALSAITHDMRRGALCYARSTLGCCRAIAARYYAACRALLRDIRFSLRA